MINNYCQSYQNNYYFNLNSKQKVNLFLLNIGIKKYIHNHNN